MWHKAVWIGHLIRLELTRERLEVKLVNHYAIQAAVIISKECKKQNDIKSKKKLLFRVLTLLQLVFR